MTTDDEGGGAIPFPVPWGAHKPPAGGERIEGWATRYKSSDPIYFKPGERKPNSKAGTVFRATLILHKERAEEKPFDPQRSQISGPL